MKISRFGLLPRILVAIVLGAVLGGFLPHWLIRTLLTFNVLFSQFLNFIVPLIIVAFVTVAIANVGRQAGRLLVITTVIAYLSTIGAGLMSLGTANWLFPSLISASNHLRAAGAHDALTPFFSIEIPPLMSVMTAIVTAFVLGIGLAYMDGRGALRQAAEDLSHIVERTISAVILPLLPLYIFGIFVDMVAKGEVAHVLSVFAKIIVIIFALHILLLLIQYCIAGAVSGRNPIRCLLNMLPAYFTALGTQSSAATIPVTLRQVQHNGVAPGVAGFVVPLCATIHLSGSMLKIVACAIALMMMQGISYTTGSMIGFIFMLAVTMIAAPGVPGGAIMAALGVLQSMLGFGEEDQALMIALYIAMDSFGTAANVTGDGAISLIVNTLWKQEPQDATK